MDAAENVAVGVRGVTPAKKLRVSTVSTVTATAAKVKKSCGALAAIALAKATKNIGQLQMTTG